MKAPKYMGRKAVAGILLPGLLLTACSSSTPSGDMGGKAGEPTPISVFMDFTIAQPPAPDNPILKEFEKNTNTKLNITWINGPDFGQRLNVALASGELSDLMKIDDVTNPVFQEMVKQGAFWDLTPYLKDYPNLQKHPQIIFDNTQINGKNYVIPVARPLNGFVFPEVRKDWLDKLGLKIPQTTDDLYKVLKAFKEKAPDGKPDTVGYTMRASTWLEEIFTGTPATSGSGTTMGAWSWKEKDGKLIDMNLEPEVRASLEFQNKLYTEGLIPADFAVMKDNQFWDMATGGRAGMTAETIEALWRWTYDQWKRDPKVEWLPLVSLDAGKGPYVPQYRGYIGVLAIPKKVPEAKMKKILSVIDYGASEEGGNLSLYGIKDVHYKDENGFKVATDKAVSDSVGVGSFGKMFMRYDPYMYAIAPGMPKEVYERNKKIIDERSKISVPDPTIGLISQTRIKAGADYAKKITDMKTQVIMGKVKLDAWDSLVADLKKDATYLKITDEMNEAYKARKQSK